ncbi:unnamed protein product [Aphanomyces euteiches]
MIQKWKGVVPALAARGHVENLPLVLDEAMRQSGLDGYKSLSAIAVTSGPGLAPCLNVGLRSAVEIAVGNDLDFISVNHLEDLGDYDVLGSTVDDSVGEAFDKVARMLELGNENTAFHGGKLVEEYAKLGNDRAFAFTEPMKKKQRKLEKPLDEATKRDLAASFQVRNLVIAKPYVPSADRHCSSCHANQIGMRNQQGNDEYSAFGMDGSLARLV